MALLGWFLLALFLVSIFSVTTIGFTPDSTRYFNEAFKLYSDQAYERTQRGPMMAVFGATAIFFSWGDPLGVLVLPRIAFCVAAIAFAGVVQSLYGWRAMPAAALAFVLMPVFHKISTLYHIDIFLIAAALLAVWAHYESLKRRSWALGALSGLLLTIAFLTKEVAILLLPLWLLGWILFPPYDRRLRLAVVASVVAVICAFVPWAVYIAYNASAGDLIGRNLNRSGAHSSAFIHGILTQPVGFLSDIPQALERFYQRYVFGPLNEKIDFGILILVSQIIVVVRSLVWRSRPDLYALLAFLCFIPLAIYLDYTQFKDRQSAVIQAMALLSVGALVPTLTTIFERIFSRIRAPRIVQTAVSALAALVPIGVVIAVAATTPYTVQAFADQPGGYSVYSGSKYRFEPTGLVSRTMLNAAVWLTDNTDEADRVLTSYRRDAHQLNTALPNREPLPMPVGRLNLKDWLMDLRAADPIGANTGSGNERNTPAGWSLRGLDRSEEVIANVIYIWANRENMGNWRCITDEDLASLAEIHCRIFYIAESDLLRFLKQTNAKYLVTGFMMPALADYYNVSPSFRLVAELSNEIPYSDGKREKVFIHQVIDTQQADTVPTKIGYTIPKMLQMFDTLRPNEFARWREDVLLGFLNLSPESLKRAYDGDLPCVKKSGESVDCAHNDPSDTHRQ